MGASVLLDSTEVTSLPQPTGGSLRWPNMAWYRNGWVVAANVFPLARDGRIQRRDLYLTHTRTGAMPLPSGDFLFAYPVLKVTRDGTLHLFWGEGPTETNGNGWPYSMTAVWHSAFLQGSWSTPELIVSGEYLEWRPLATQVADDGGGGLLVVVDVAAPRRPDELQLFASRGGTWTLLHTGSHGGTPAIARLPDGRLVLVYMTGARGAPNQLLVRESGDEGRTWSTAREVFSGPVREAAYWPQLHAEGDTLFLGWYESRDDVNTSWNLAMAIAGPGALDWRLVARQAIEGVTFEPSFAAIGCGRVLALLQSLSTTSAPLLTRVALRGEATGTERSVEQLALAPGIVRDGGRVAEVWSRMDTTARRIFPVLRERRAC